MASIKEIAEMTGLSPATISHVINNNRAVSAQSRELVNAAIQKTGYIPNHFAKALKTNKTNLVAFILPTIENGPNERNISNDSFIPLLNGAQECLYKNGCELMVISYSEGSGGEELEKFNFLKSKLVDGILMVPFDRKADIGKFVETVGVPVVLCDRRIENCSLPTVYADNYEGAKKLVKHLAEQGYSRIAFIGGTLLTSVGYDRLKGFKDALIELNLLVDENLIKYFSQIEVEDGERAMEEVLKNGAEAVCLSNHILTIGALRYCSKNHVDISKEIGIVSMDDYEWLKVTGSGITAMSQDHYSMGMKSAEKLLSILRGERNINRVEKLDCEILIRQT